LPRKEATWRVDEREAVNIPPKKKAPRNISLLENLKKGPTKSYGLNCQKKSVAQNHSQDSQGLRKGRKQTPKPRTWGGKGPEAGQLVRRGFAQNKVR